ncbi:LuxE/PaaK family acyltransferase [Rubrivivax gelatinosus]|uniref:Acyl-protein synthetase, LuxE n=1 Tax=Rubrivivax gelatinosus (strain NBRC 100245 / IL144) TaxID=983917 RepID=I0HWT2_RUBGI|nr:acyl-protein synthetase [Rubrivivax gelatinosus]BAL97469.1 acyl-protein synthetase, LuxE [Rubrivivax gelatinosus IL144]
MVTSFLDWPVYGLGATDKRARLDSLLNSLTKHHRDHCEPYARILAARGYRVQTVAAAEDIPWLPVRLFKMYDLRSVTSNHIFKTLTSSGTTGQSPSRIALDKSTAANQTTALVRIMQEFLGKARLPMLIIDHPGVIKDRSSFSARGAGILGLANFGRGHVYALNDDMSLNINAVRNFCRQYSGTPKLVFGFTFMIWQYFLHELEMLGETLNLTDSTLFHSGGWKKLEAIAVDNQEFKRRLRAACGAIRIHNFYGMVEQVGSVFVECEQGHLHAPAFADVIVRDPITWQVMPAHKPGVIQVLSALPQSYPGHSLLTEDLGTLLGEDDCSCGRRGRYFHVHGRMPRAEIRGCSDTQTTPTRASK